MLNILQRYGIKEVADVTFYELDDAGNPSKPVLMLDSLKVTSIEQTAESSEARGGKGNAKLIVWDYGKELTVTIEDALFSPKSLAIMMADGKVKNASSTTFNDQTVKRSARVVATTNGNINTPPEIVVDGRKLAQKKYVNASTTTGITVDSTDTTGEVEVKWYKAESEQKELSLVSPNRVTDTAFETGEVYIATWDHPVKQTSTITITPDSFPGTYYVTGDTLVRSDTTGKDEYFQFIVYKAKMQAEQTISMEAEGDPSTFNMTLQVLRAANGKMIDFVKYEIYDGTITPNDASDDKDGWLTPSATN
jgi:hypothetical protein